MLSRALPRIRPRRPQLQSFQLRPASTKPTTRASRILAKLPPSLQRYTTRLRAAPLSHVLAFLVLHELTAVIPVLGLFTLFHYTPYAPTNYVTAHWGAYVTDGVRTFEKYFRRKGWFGFGAEDVASTDAEGEPGTGSETKRHVRDWEGAEGRYKLLADVALAWAVTKAILPVRILASLWATPWFAGVLVRGRALLSRKP